MDLDSLMSLDGPFIKILVSVAVICSGYLIYDAVHATYKASETFRIKQVRHSIKSGLPPFEDTQLWFNFDGNTKFERNYYSYILRSKK